METWRLQQTPIPIPSAASTGGNVEASADSDSALTLVTPRELAIPRMHHRYIQLKRHLVGKQGTGSLKVSPFEFVLLALFYLLFVKGSQQVKFPTPPVPPVPSKEMRQNVKKGWRKYQLTTDKRLNNLNL